MTLILNSKQMRSWEEGLMEVIAQDKLSDEDALHILGLIRGNAPSLSLQWEENPSLIHFSFTNAASFAGS